ncbi:hypothetical protein Taro_010697, partial [Colocasia esculenta]|nr:hypothetical protein [Colocasia esculenta]
RLLDVHRRLSIYLTPITNNLSFTWLPGSPMTRWASVAFGAGIGVGSAYIQCSYIFEGSSSEQSVYRTPIPFDSLSQLNGQGLQISNAQLQRTQGSNSRCVPQSPPNVVFLMVHIIINIRR